MDIAVNVILAKDGTEILEICANGNVYRMNSLYRPEAEAEKFAKQYENMEKESILVVFGYGNGIFPRAIMETCGEAAKVIFYEPEEAVLRSIKDLREIDNVLGERGYLVTSGKPREGKPYYPVSEFPRLLEELIDYFNQEKVQYTALPKYREIFPEQYDYFAERINYQIRRNRANAATARLMGHDAVVNNIKNLRYIAKSYCGDSFCGVFPEDMAAIIVSAGPSLEKNVHLLKQAKGHAFIVCVDSAVKYLLERDIVPDILVSVDPCKPTALFDDERINGIPVVGGTDMNYRILEMLPESKIIFGSGENTYIQSLYEAAGHKLEQLESGGSVATLAFSLCRYWGFKCIILTGQDLALKGQQMYVGREKELVARGFLLETEDIYGNTVYTLREYIAYLRWFEQSVAAHPEIRVIDATEGGAKIEGTEIMTLKEALAGQAEVEFDFGACLDRVEPAFSLSRRETVWQRIQDSKQNLYRLKEKLKEGISLAGQGLKLAEKGVNSSREYSSINQQIQEICEFYNALEEDFFIQREIDASNLELFIGLFEQKGQVLPAERYKKLKIYFELLLEAAEAVCVVWDGL
ncbi:MAG: DUF115 domain-containing protein [Bacteroidales bacterium]|nr:DUF115 domain-containing protein [Clostridium sp.]MCM1203840.1 DUF115 domain-containing protein [Bacteroidales bacterium]